MNLDDNDFIRAYFFQRHLLRVLGAQQIDAAFSTGGGEAMRRMGPWAEGE